MQPPGNPASQLSAFVVEGVPRYLLTLWEYVCRRPRRFFLQYEQQPERYMAPWPFLLLNAALAAALTVLTERGTKPPRWDWTAFTGWLFIALVANMFVVAYGALAGRLV